MSYDLVAEATQPVNWESVLSRIEPYSAYFEITPPSTPSDGLVIAVHDQVFWQQLHGLMLLLREEFGMDVIDTYSGDTITESNIEQVRQNFLGLQS
jgi:hypothetical protein